MQKRPHWGSDNCANDAALNKMLSWSLAIPMVAGLVLAQPAPAAAQEFSKNPIGFDAGSRNMVDPVGNERDQQGNLVRASINDIDSGNSTACGLGATAVGNLVSVVLNGSGNTVIIDATQENSGDITSIADLGSGVFAGC